MRLEVIGANGSSAAYGRNCALHRPRGRDVCDAQGRLVRARLRLEFYRQLHGDELFALLERRVLVAETILDFGL